MRCLKAIYIALPVLIAVVGLVGCGGGSSPTNSNELNTNTVGETSNDPAQSIGSDTCTDTFPYRDGQGWNGRSSCKLEGIVFLDPENPPDINMVALLPVPDTDPAFVINDDSLNPDLTDIKVSRRINN